MKRCGFIALFAWSLASIAAAAEGCPFKTSSELESATSDAFGKLRNYPLRTKPASELKLKFNSKEASYNEIDSWALPFQVFDGHELVAEMVSIIPCDDNVEFSVKWRKK